MDSKKIDCIKEVPKVEIARLDAVKNLAAEMRPKQWVKNFLLFLPMIFAKKLFDPSAGSSVMAGFFCFSLTASAVYLLNDVYDLSSDKMHPVKKERPLASGRLKSPQVLALSFILILSTLFFGFFLNRTFGIVLLAYFLLNLLYSEHLKHALILDVLALGLMFNLRVTAGSVLAHVEASFWLQICTFMLALFLGFAKRRHELTLLDRHQEKHRRVLEHYDPYFLDQMMAIATASTVMSYILYTVSEETFRKFGTRALLYTTPFVLYGIYRYLYLIHRKNKGGDPAAVILADKSMILNLVLWVCSVTLILYCT